MRDPQNGDEEACVAEKNPNRWDLRNQSMATCDVIVTLRGYLEHRSKRAERNSTDYFIQASHIIEVERENGSQKLIY